MPDPQDAMPVDYAEPPNDCVAEPNRAALRALPSVEQAVLELTDGSAEAMPRPLLVRVVRENLEQLRSVALGRNVGVVLDQRDEVMALLRDRVAAVARERLRPVVNATGVPLHTNLGRAPLGHAVEELKRVAGGYNTLEFSVESGERGRRGSYLERLLMVVAESESATLVNNCAGGLVLALRHFIGRDRDEVIISRGELVEIGGSFRIPDILASSGAVLREVGTTNRTRKSDYAEAIGPRTALLLKVHQSNFAIQGFTEETGLVELAELGVDHGVPVMHDLGSGAAMDTAEVPGVPHEPTPAESLASGADLVCFSGDKLLGGPQAGVLAGDKTHVAGIKRDPLFRALRCNKLVFAAMEATADAILSGRGTALETMLKVPMEELQGRAESVLRKVLDSGSGEAFDLGVVPMVGRMGGGTLPTASMPSCGIRIRPGSGDTTVDELLRRLRMEDPVVVGKIADGAVLLDFRTILSAQDEVLAKVLARVLR